MTDIIAQAIMGLLFLILAVIIIQVLVKDIMYSNKTSLPFRILMGTFLTVVMFIFTTAASIDETMVVLKIIN
jgi:hypothetical protein